MRRAAMHAGVREPRTVRGGTSAMLARVGCVIFLSAFVFVGSGCHELYCGFIEGLSGEPLDCSHDEFPDLGDIEFPPLPPPPSLPTAITMNGEAIAGQPVEFIASNNLGAGARYRWDLDGDGAEDDYDATGDAGKTVTATYPEPGRRRVSVTVTNEAMARRGGRLEFEVLPAPAPSPPPASPLVVSIDLDPVVIPPEETPAVQVTATVSRDAAPAPGASVEFDFETDGTVDATATTDANGQAQATHEYPNGDHQVTVSARLGESTGTASREFSYFNGEITAAPPHASAARADRGEPFSARLVFATLKTGERVATPREVRRIGELALGRLTGRTTRRRPAHGRQAATGAKAFVPSVWVSRSVFIAERKRERLRAKGFALASYARLPGQACVRYSIKGRAVRDPGPKRPNPGRGRMRIVGGTGAAATISATARFRVTAKGRALAFRGTFRKRAVERRGLAPGCQRLVAELRDLPG